MSEWTAQEDRNIDVFLYNIIFYIHKELIMKNLITLFIIIVISLMQMLFKSQTIQTRIIKKAKEDAKGESDLFNEINCKDTPKKERQAICYTRNISATNSFLKCHLINKVQKVLDIPNIRFIRQKITQ